MELAGAEAPGGAGEAAASVAAEAAARAPLAAAALRALRAARPAARSRRLLAALFGRVTAVLAAPHAPQEVLVEVASLLSEAVAPLLAEDERARGRGE